MRTFWTYFFIFLALVVFIQVFQYFSSNNTFELNYSVLLKQVSLVFLIALITSYIVPRKKKNPFKEKAN
ncbi:Uncharacterised protein [Sphingobacterium daejeonense]|nr:Uncharacterised protein [Sphingobacterium daejeonense]